MSGIDLKDKSILYDIYRNELLQDCVPFWLEHSLDKEYEGYFTTIERDGVPHGQAKYLWPQGRSAYIYSKIYNDIEKNDEYLEAARIGVDFIDNYAFDSEGRAYYKVLRDGRPMYGRPSQIFTEAFIVLAYAEYAKASGEEKYLTKAEDLFRHIINRIESGTLKDGSFNSNNIFLEHAEPMILTNVAQELRNVRDNPKYTELIEKWVHDELYVFAKDDLKAMFERVNSDGSANLEEPEGRTITPGHCMESCWFCMREGIYRDDRKTIDRAAEIMDWTMQRGWDEEYGGIFNFIDVLGKSPGHHDEDWGEDQDWDEKVFWVHGESLYALLSAYLTTKQERFFDWYKKVHFWSFGHFPDREFGEWFGYLRRDGSVSQTLKGTIKGLFHLPRAYIFAMLLLENHPEDRI